MNDEVLKKKVWDETYQKSYQTAKSFIADKRKREEAFEAVVIDFLSQYTEEDGIDEALVKRYYHEVHKEAARRLVLDENVRLDGRKPDQIRQINCEIMVQPYLQEEKPSH
jgi:polyribonucleotide nucleotidyltransferase